MLLCLMCWLESPMVGHGLFLFSAHGTHRVLYPLILCTLRIR